jgi:hypothetical protein
MPQRFQNQIAFHFGNGAADQTDHIGHSRRPPSRLGTPACGEIARAKLCLRQALPAPWLAAG